MQSTTGPRGVQVWWHRCSECYSAEGNFHSSVRVLPKPWHQRLDHENVIAGGLPKCTGLASRWKRRETDDIAQCILLVQNSFHNKPRECFALYCEYLPNYSMQLHTIVIFKCRHASINPSSLNLALWVIPGRVILSSNQKSKADS